MSIIFCHFELLAVINSRRNFSSFFAVQTLADGIDEGNIDVDGFSVDGFPDGATDETLGADVGETVGLDVGDTGLDF